MVPTAGGALLTLGGRVPETGLRWYPVLLGWPLASAGQILSSALSWFPTSPYTSRVYPGPTPSPKYRLYQGCPDTLLQRFPPRATEDEKGH